MYDRKHYEQRLWADGPISIVSLGTYAVAEDIVASEDI